MTGHLNGSGEAGNVNIRVTIQRKKTEKTKKDLTWFFAILLIFRMLPEAPRIPSNRRSERFKVEISLAG